MTTIRDRVLPAAFGMLLQASSTVAQPLFEEAQSYLITFEGCLATIDQYAHQIGISPEVIIETADVLTVRFSVRGARVIVTCSRPNNTMTITLVRPGCDPGGPC